MFFCSQDLPGRHDCKCKEGCTGDPFSKCVCDAPAEPNRPPETETSCEPKECVIEDKTDYNGMDIKWEIRESQQACADWCASTDGCCFWSWNGNKECYVKTGIGRKSKNPRGVSGNRACGKNSEPIAPLEPNGPSETDTSCEPKGCVIDKKTDYNGDDIKDHKRTESQQACADWCASTEGCCFWTWNKHKECYVKSGKGQKLKNSGAVSGSRGCGKNSELSAPSEPKGPSESDTSCGPRECLIDEKTDYNGDDIPGGKKTESQQACADLCASTEGCCFWTWQKNNQGKGLFSKGKGAKRCVVKSGKGRIKKNSGMVSGNRACGTGKLRGSSWVD